MTEPRRDNLLIVHWHDLGRYLGAYGHADVHSPRLDALAAEGILFTHAHATAPLCSRRGARSSPADTRTATAWSGWRTTAGSTGPVSGHSPTILTESGWYTALFGMQHETACRPRLGFDEFDVSNSYCEYVVERAAEWLPNPPARNRSC